jgi:hypothetical protein
VWCSNCSDDLLRRCSAHLLCSVPLTTRHLVAVQHIKRTGWVRLSQRGTPVSADVQNLVQVRETLDFAARVQGGGRRPQELRQLQELEAAAGFLPDPEIDAFMKVTCQCVHTGGLRRHGRDSVSSWDTIFG